MQALSRRPSDRLTVRFLPSHIISSQEHFDTDRTFSSSCIDNPAMTLVRHHAVDNTASNPLRRALHSSTHYFPTDCEQLAVRRQNATVGAVLAGFSVVLFLPSLALCNSYDVRLPRPWTFLRRDARRLSDGNLRLETRSVRLLCSLG